MNHKLREPNIVKKYQENINIEMEKLMVECENLNNEELWEKFRDSVIRVARTVCGTHRINTNKKQTAWWNESIKGQIKIKKKTWLRYLCNRTEDNYNIYKKQREKAKNMIRESKKQTWKEFGEKLEQDSVGNQKLFYNILKTLRKKRNSDIIAIKNEKGEMLTEEKQIMERWKNYFEKLLNPQRTQNTELSKTERRHEEDEREIFITKGEVQDAIKKLKNGKAAGFDRITAEMLKHIGDWGTQLLVKLYNKTIQLGIPKEWTIGMIVPIYKKGDKKDCHNYRGITLLSVVFKVYEQIIEHKLRKIIEPTLEETQSGFRRGRSTQDHVFTIKNIINKTLSTNKTTYMGFLDLEKAFDSVPRTKIWESLEKRKVGSNLMMIVKNLYEETNNCIIFRNMRSQIFSTKEGVRQGGGLSPLLFITVMDDNIKECKQRTKATIVGYRNLKTVEITECAFADDIVLIANSERNLQENLTVWSEVLKKWVEIKQRKNKSNDSIKREDSD